MNLIKTNIDGLVILEPKVFGDNRGYFFESYNKNTLAELGIHDEFIQDNESRSTYGVLRGLHYQLPPYTQSKLVRVIDGKVLDIALDIRADSPTYGKHFKVLLTGENKRQFYVPKGFAHGFIVLSEVATFAYKCNAKYAPDSEAGIMYNDKDLAIDWEIDAKLIKLSDKDTRNPQFKDIKPWVK